MSIVRASLFSASGGVEQGVDIMTILGDQPGTADSRSGMFHDHPWHNDNHSAMAVLGRIYSPVIVFVDADAKMLGGDQVFLWDR